MSKEQGTAEGPSSSDSWPMPRFCLTVLQLGLTKTALWWKGLGAPSAGLNFRISTSSLDTERERASERGPFSPRLNLFCHAALDAPHTLGLARGSGGGEHRTGLGTRKLVWSHPKEGRLMKEGRGDSQVHRGRPRDLPGLPDGTSTYVAIAWPDNSRGSADLDIKCRAHTFR